MKRDEFRDLLEAYGYDDEQIPACEHGVELLETYLADLPVPTALDGATAGDVPSLASLLIDRGLNERIGFVGVYLYAGMIGNRDLAIAAPNSSTAHPATTTSPFHDPGQSSGVWRGKQHENVRRFPRRIPGGG